MLKSRETVFEITSADMNTMVDLLEGIKLLALCSDYPSIHTAYTDPSITVSPLEYHLKYLGRGYYFSSFTSPGRCTMTLFEGDPRVNATPLQNDDGSITIATYLQLRMSLEDGWLDQVCREEVRGAQSARDCALQLRAKIPAKWFEKGRCRRSTSSTTTSEVSE